MAIIVAWRDEERFRIWRVVDEEMSRETRREWREEIARVWQRLDLSARVSGRRRMRIRVRRTELKDYGAVLDNRSVLVFLYGLEPTCGWGDDDDWRGAEVADKRDIG